MTNDARTTGLHEALLKIMDVTEKTTERGDNSPTVYGIARDALVSAKLPITRRRVHELKISRENMDAVMSGAMTYQIRYNDRDFHDGDIVILREWWPEAGYTTRKVTAKIGAVSTYEQADGYVVFSLLRIESRDDYFIG
jgi:hypothetical protein